MCRCWDTLLCCFGCLTCLGCRDRITDKLVFFPPECSYALEFHPHHTLWLRDNEALVSPYSHHTLFSLHQFNTSRGHICTAFLQRAQQATYTILFSHGNATDIGAMRDHLIDLAQHLHVNIFAYDYSGYGLSSGQCSVANVQADIRAAFIYLTQQLKIPEDTIILYGQSLGSGPTCYLASRPEGKNIKGIILHSPLLSGVRVVRPNASRTWFFDIFPNIDWIKTIEKPVFILHGTGDREIPVTHGQILYDNSNQLYDPWFVEGAGHNDIEFHWREELFERLQLFLCYLSSQDDRGQSSDHE